MHTKKDKGVGRLVIMCGAAVRAHVVLQFYLVHKLNAMHGRAPGLYLYRQRTDTLAWSEIMPLPLGPSGAGSKPPPPFRCCGGKTPLFPELELSPKAMTKARHCCGACMVAENEANAAFWQNRQPVAHIIKSFTAQ